MKTIIKKHKFGSIETLEYTSKNADKLLFLQHGIYGKKEKTMNLFGVSFVKLGYHVVATDAYKHGSRSEEPFASQDEDQSQLETMMVVKHSAQDIKNVYENHFQDTYDMFDIVGISMGGFIAHYLTTITDNINTVVALISSPKFIESANYTFPKEKQEEYPESTSVKKTIGKMDPSRHVNKMQFNRMIMFNGQHDETIPSSQSEAFYLNHPELNIIYKAFDTDHKINKEMHNALLELLKD